jgi:hypothetical protein
MVGVFTARLAGWDGWDRGFGIVALLVALPATYLLVRALGGGRPLLYFIWIAVILLFQLVELLLDYVFAVDFRHNTTVVIPYVMLFFAAMGALIGLASQAGRAWVMITGPLFLVVAALTFVSRAVTGI